MVIGKRAKERKATEKKQFIHHFVLGESRLGKLTQNM